MSKKEKIAITVCSLIGFALFCLAMVPISLLLGYLFGEQTCFIYVEYDKLPYAMGEEYVYISPTFFDEYGFEPDDTVSIMYTGKWGQYKDSNFKTPVKKSREYWFSVEEEVDYDDYDLSLRIDVSCDKTGYYDESSYKNTYGKYKYNEVAYIAEGVEESYYDLEYFVFAHADSGNPCSFKVHFYVTEEYADSSQEEREGVLKYQKLFESMLDNLVGYSYFQ